MKKLIYKTWAKILAFILLVIMALAVAASCFGIASVVDFNAYSIDGNEAQRRAVAGSVFSQQMVFAENY